jgi:dTDP-glucose pyrophosphorylase
MTSGELFWSQALLPEDSKIRDAIQVLNDASLRIVLVVDANEVLVGTISDGDIRRGLLKGLDLSSPIELIVHRDALVVTPEMSREAVLQLMTENKIQQIPIVDNEKRVLGLHVWDQFYTHVPRSNIMIIMAGGKGVRLHPQTENCPKPLLPVAGKPILQHIIERAKIEGFSHFVIAIHYLGHMIEDYFGNGEIFGVRIDYLREQSPLGTAGALSLLSPLPELPFLVTNGDVLSDIRYGELLDFHIQHSAMASMAVRAQESQNPFGVVTISGPDIVGYEEKPVSRNYINAGVYVIEPNAIDLLERDKHCDMPNFFQVMQSQKMRTIAYPIHERWLDVGRPEDLKIASMENLKKESRE